VIAFCTAALGAKAKPGVQPSTAASSKAKPAAPTLSVAKKGSYVYWFTFTDADGAARTSLPVRFKGTFAELDIGALGAKYSGAKLYVMDKKTGNLAIAEYPPSASTKDVELSADDFDRVRNVRLRIVAEDGKPIESASAAASRDTQSFIGRVSPVGRVPFGRGDFLHERPALRCGLLAARASGCVGGFSINPNSLEIGVWKRLPQPKRS